MVNELSRIVTSMCLKGSVSRAVEEDEHETSDVLLRKREKDTDNTSTLWNTGMRFQTVFQVEVSLSLFHERERGKGTISSRSFPHKLVDQDLPFGGDIFFLINF